MLEVFDVVETVKGVDVDPLKKELSWVKEIRILGEEFVDVLVVELAKEVVVSILVTLVLILPAEAVVAGKSDAVLQMSVSGPVLWIDVQTSHERSVTAGYPGYNNRAESRSGETI